jgi:hypothetical protein
MPFNPPANNTKTGNGDDLFSVSGGGGGGGGGNVVLGTGQNLNANPIEATFWEIGDLLFCAVMIQSATLEPGFSTGNGIFRLPAGKAWLQGSQAGFPQTVCSAFSPTLSYSAVSGPLIANSKVNISEPTNQSITVQCVDENGTGVSAFVNVLAWGPKAPAP